jgi:hypothetical protein
MCHCHFEGHLYHIPGPGATNFFVFNFAVVLTRRNGYRVNIAINNLLLITTIQCKVLYKHSRVTMRTSYLSLTLLSDLGNGGPGNVRTGKWGSMLTQGVQSQGANGIGGGSAACSIGLGPVFVSDLFVSPFSAGCGGKAMCGNVVCTSKSAHNEVRRS